MRIALMALAVVACGKPSGPATYTVVSPTNEPPGGVKFTAVTPDGWSAKVENGDPTFYVGSQSIQTATILLSSCRGDDAESCLESAIKMQFGDKEKRAAVKTEKLDGGRLWMRKDENGKIHARMFYAPMVDKHAVLECVMVFGDEKDLPAFRSLCDSVKLVP